MSVPKNAATSIVLLHVCCAWTDFFQHIFWEYYLGGLGINICIHTHTQMVWYASPIKCFSLCVRMASFTARHVVLNFERSVDLQNTTETTDTAIL